MMSNHGMSLRNAGLTNHETEDLGVLAMHSNKGEIAPFCTGPACCVSILGRKNQVRKYGVDQSKIDCPDCGHALLWKTSRAQVA